LMADNCGKKIEGKKESLYQAKLFLQLAEK
jgi:hypothetical protein